VLILSPNEKLKGGRRAAFSLIEAAPREASPIKCVHPLSIFQLEMFSFRSNLAIFMA